MLYSIVVSCVCLEKGTSATLYESRRESKVYRKKRLGYNRIYIVIQSTRRSNECLIVPLGDFEDGRDFCQTLTPRINVGF